MISEATKAKLLTELEKTGNIGLACVRSGVARSSYYRLTENLEFKQKCDEVLETGRSSNCDVVEQSLLKKAVGGDLGAIKFFMTHNSSRYMSEKVVEVTSPTTLPNSDPHIVTAIAKEIIRRLEARDKLEIKEIAKHLARELGVKDEEKKEDDVVEKILRRAGVPVYKDRFKDEES